MRSQMEGREREEEGRRREEEGRRRGKEGGHLLSVDTEEGGGEGRREGTYRQWILNPRGQAGT